MIILILQDYFNNDITVLDVCGSAYQQTKKIATLSTHFHSGNFSEYALLKACFDIKV